MKRRTYADWFPVCPSCNPDEDITTADHIEKEAYTIKFDPYRHRYEVRCKLCARLIRSYVTREEGGL